MELVIRRISIEFVKDFWHQLTVSQILYNFGHNTSNTWYQLTGSLQFTFVNDVTDNLPAGILLLISEASQTQFQWLLEIVLHLLRKLKTYICFPSLFSSTRFNDRMVVISLGGLLTITIIIFCDISSKGWVKQHLDHSTMGQCTGGAW